MSTLYWCGVTNHNNFIDCVTNPVITLTMILACYSCDNHRGFPPPLNMVQPTYFRPATRGGPAVRGSVLLFHNFFAQR